MMNKDLFQLLNTVKLVDVVITTALFIIIVGILISQRKRIKQALENWREKRNFEETVMLAVNNNTEKINELESTMIKARETSKDIRAEMYDDLKEVSNDVKSIVKTLNDIQEKEALSKQANIKKKIEDTYRKCYESKKITDTEYESLQDLICDYERYGGTNSFVHTLVIPEMYHWEITKTIPKK